MTGGRNGVTHIRMVVEYDGEAFAGWQRQENARTVQGEIEQALRTIAGQEVRIVGGGRTDAGVHATGQVASFALTADVDPAGLMKSLNGVLGRDVRIVSAGRVAPDFHARYSAVSRTYRYSITRKPTALRRGTHWYVGWDLDLEVLRASASAVVGEHDFRGFAKAGSNVRHWICRVSESRWDTRDDELIYTITSDRFLYGMVRCLVGTMVDEARGHADAGRVREILDTGDRGRAGMAAPPHGLCLTEISYEG